MPKNNVSDLITDQEIAFARLILSGTMTDRQAAEAVGLNPDTAAYTKSKPRVQAYMLEHRALMQQQLVEQEAEALRRRSQRREQVLDRLWELASLSSEMTRGSITGQVKAISMIVAIEGMIPDRRAGSAQMKPAPQPTQPQIDPDAWRARQQAEATSPQNKPGQEEDGFGISEAEPASALAENAPASDLTFDPGESNLANGLSLSETQSAPRTAFAPDTRVPFSIKKNPFAPRR